MAIDSPAKRRAAASTAFHYSPVVLPLGPGAATIQRRAAGRGYWTTITVVAPYSPTARRSTLGASLFFPSDNGRYQLWVSNRCLTATNNVMIGSIQMSKQSSGNATLGFQATGPLRAPVDNPAAQRRAAASTVAGLPIVVLPLGSAGAAKQRRAAGKGYYFGDAGYEPRRDEPVKLYGKTGLLMYSGFVDTVIRHNDETEQLWVDVKCIDAAILCARRAFSGQFSTPTTANAIIAAVVAQALQGTGITFVPDPAVDVTFTQPQPIGFPIEYVSDLFNTLAGSMNCDWTVDENLNLIFFNPNSGTTGAPCDFDDTIVDGQKTWQTVSDQITGVRFANRVWVKTSSQVAATVTDTDPGVASGIYLTRYPLTATPQVTVNGTAQVVVESADVGANPGWQFVYVNNSQQLNYNPALTPLSSSDVVVITYLSPLPYAAMAEDAASIALVGLFEEILDGGSISSQPQLQAIAAAELLRLSTTPQLPTLTTRVDGFKPGQSVDINIAELNLVGRFIVLRVSSRVVVQEYFNHTVQCALGPWQAVSNAASFFQSLVQGGQIATSPVTLPVATVAFVVAGTVEGATNPGVTPGNKQAIVTAAEAFVAGFWRLTWKTPPTTGVVFDMFQNGVSIFTAPQSVGTDVTTKKATFRVSPLNILEGDKFTIVIVTGDLTAKDGYLELVGK